MKLFWKKLQVPESNQVKEIDAVQLWEVRWFGIRDWDERYSCITKERNAEFFTSETDAVEFQKSLLAAFKLLKIQGSGTVVDFKKSEDKS